MTWKTLLAGAALCLGALQAQDADVLKVPLTDPARPVNLTVTALNGTITVRGYDGKEVLVRSGSKAESRARRTPDKAKGLRRIDLNKGGLTVEEEDNRVEISTGSGAFMEVSVQVPRRCSLKVRLVNGGGVLVENIDGEIDANVTNGHLTMNDISGSAIGHALNDNVTVTFARIADGKPMSLSSLNGDIDVTLPAATKARLRVKTDNGDIYTDFDFKPEPGRAPTVEERNSGKGRYRVRIDHSMTGTINGGGPDYQFTSQNGRIFIRKR